MASVVGCFKSCNLLMCISSQTNDGHTSEGNAEVVTSKDGEVGYDHGPSATINETYKQGIYSKHDTLVLSS